MSQSSATSTVRSFRDWSGRLTAPPDWTRLAACVKGPLLTLAAAVLLDVLRREQIGLFSPFPVLLLTVMYSASAAGLRPALVSVAVTVVDAVHFFAEPGFPLRYGTEATASLLAVSGAALLVAVVVSRLHERPRRVEPLQLGRHEAQALARRFGILEQAGLILSSDRDPETTFRDFARLLSPTLADWCLVHLADEAGRLHCVATAHRDPSRDLVVRALADYGDRGLPFGVLRGSPGVIPVSERLLRAVAADEEQLKLYRALAPTEILRLPLGDTQPMQGVVTLAMASDSGRRFSPRDVSLAHEVAQAGGLAVENVRLRRERGELERRASLVFDANPQPMWIFDVDTLAFLAVNDATVQHYGFSRDEFLSMTIMDLLPPDDVTPLAALERGPDHGETALARHRRRDGSVVDVEIVSHELNMDGRRTRLVLATDISERARARAALRERDEQLRQSQRTEALGRIGEGVAHDFNNLLTTIRGFGEMLLRDLPEEDRRRHDVQRICQAADRGALLTRQLLSFGRSRAQEPMSVNLNQLVRGMEPLIRQLVGADVELDVRLAAGIGRVLVDPAQMEHVLLTLVLHARDAMPAGGRLAIETAERRISGSAPGRPVRAGRYVMLAVGDTGDGDEDAPRGALGRSSLFGILRQYGGAVRVASEPGQGTVVKVYLPRVDGEDEPEPEPTTAWRGTETVLVAEDEDGVRELTRKILADFGYTVVAARHGRDALLMAAEHGGTVDLLVTDVVMPEMNGRQLAEQLRQGRPDLKVLFMSGYADDEVLQRGISERDVAFLRKPFAAEELARRVRGLLDGS